MSVKKYPKNIGIIMDGNRRFAKSLNLDPRKGHEFGEKKLKDVLNWCKEFDIKELTLYTFSLQNFNRPKSEFDYLMNLFKEACKKLLTDDTIDTKGIKINFLGKLELFPLEVQELTKKVVEKTKDNCDRILNFAFGYGGREEIVQAVKNLGLDIENKKINAKDINEKLISNYLYTANEPDLIIRTGGEVRTSNFLMWQTPYTEWIFLDVKWPEFSKEDFEKCMNEYSNRDIRRGK